MGGFSRIVLAALAAASLAACGLLNDPRGPDRAMDGAQVFGTDYADKAISLLSKGDYGNAERYAMSALRNNPKDPYALYAAGLIYQATSRYDLARQYYEVLLAIRPQITVTVVADGMPQIRAMVDVAQANMAMIDKVTGRTSPRTMAQSGRPSDAAPQLEPLMPMTGSGRGVVSAEPLSDVTMAGGGSGLIPQAEANVVNRFRILKHLLDDALITPEEYSRRRNANFGALAPYSAKLMPSQGLQRPGPTDAQVIDRLRELSRALESRAISPAEHQAERSVILDALLPAEPRRLELPVLPPKDVMEAAAAVGRVERMRVANLLSGDEAKREKDAIEKTLDSQLSKVPVSGSATGLRHGSATDKTGARPSSASASSSAGVSLATLKSEEEAQQTWEKLKGKYPEELGALSATMRRVDMGEKGSRWKVVAGPMKSQADARKLCKVLKLYRQACDVTGY